VQLPLTANPYAPTWCRSRPQSVLVVAGGLLRSQEGQDEQDVLFRALRCVVRHALSSQPVCCRGRCPLACRWSAARFAC